MPHHCLVLHRRFVLALPLLLLPTIPAAAQLPSVRNGIFYSSSEVGANGQPTNTVWQLSKDEIYAQFSLHATIHDLAFSALVYSTDHNEEFPALASELFHSDYITNPRVFYNPGDANEPPTTINNDVLDAPNSSRISFDYFGAGQSPIDPELILFQDNSAANNFGLGKFAAYADAQTVFIPEQPHVFQDCGFELLHDSPARIYRPGVGWGRYSLNVPSGMRSESTVSPHRFVMNVESSITPETHDLFETEGYHGQEFASVSSSANYLLSEFRVQGSGDIVPLTLYLQFSGIVSRETTDAADSLFWNATWDTTFEFLPNVRDLASFGWTSPGLLVLNMTVFLEHHPLAPGEQGFLPEHDSIRVRGIAQLTTYARVNQTGTLFFFLSFGANTPLEKGMLGAHKVGHCVTEIPATPTLEQLVVFAPPGHQIQFQNSYLTDLIRAAVRGDANLDGLVEYADRAAFNAAYSHPQVSLQYEEPDADKLVAFDFDGDADVDCADWTMFAANWSPDELPVPIVPCASDFDNDGIPDGDDDCAMTAVGTIVDDRGCPRGDFDADADIDLVDWMYFVECSPSEYGFPLPAAPYLLSHCWNSFDTVGDKQIGFVDMAVFQNAFTGSMP